MAQGQVITAKLERADTQFRMPGRCEYAEFQLRRDFPDGTVAVESAGRGGALQIAVGVDYHLTKRGSPVAAASEIVEVALRPSAA